MKNQAIWQVARDEAERWGVMKPIAMAILFCFVYRWTHGETFEDLMK